MHVMMRKLESMDSAMRRMDIQQGQLDASMPDQDKEKLPSQPEQAKVMTVLRSGKVIDNNVGLHVTNYLPIHGGTTVKDGACDVGIKEENGEVDRSQNDPRTC